MNRQELVLATLAAAGGQAYQPVQLQKAVFLLDRNLPQGTLIEPFSFQPYDYGPFDANVYFAADELKQRGLAEISWVNGGRWKSYAATNIGVTEGKLLLQKLPPAHRKYIEDVSAWVRSMSFSSLVKSIYSAYPETKANSIFSD